MHRRDCDVGIFNSFEDGGKTVKWNHLLMTGLLTIPEGKRDNHDTGEQPDNNKRTKENEKTG